MAKIKTSTQDLVTGIVGTRPVEKEETKFEPAEQTASFEVKENDNKTKKVRKVRKPTLENPQGITINIQGKPFNKLRYLIMSNKLQGKKPDTASDILRPLIEDWINENCPEVPASFSTDDE